MAFWNSITFLKFDASFSALRMIYITNRCKGDNVRRLEISSFRPPWDKFERLNVSRLSRLGVLSLSDFQHFDQDFWTELPKFEALHTLKFSLNEIDDNKLIEGLNGCPRLRKLSITIAKVWTLNELTNLKGLEFLAVQLVTRKRQIGSTPQEFAISFKVGTNMKQNFPKLQKFFFRGSISRSGFQELQGLPITALSFESSLLNEQCIPLLASMECLTEVYVFKNRGMRGRATQPTPPLDWSELTEKREKPVELRTLDIEYDYGDRAFWDDLINL